MATLTIRGHATRGKEVIEILEMLGGENKHELVGNRFNSVYFIEGEVIVCEHPRFIEGIKWFSIEEFLEKYPYKVGDKVKNARINDFVGRIINVRWDNNEEQVIYTVEFGDVTKSTLTCFAKGLQPYKELIAIKENSFENLQTEGVLVKAEKTITTEEFNHNSKEWIIDRLACMSADDALHNISNLYDELHKPQFPTTYEECCKVLNKTTYIGFDGLSLVEVELYKPFVKLMRCRDAYRKMACDWKPDWTKADERKYCIANTEGNITKWVQKTTNKILAFPTEEIRDAFYENFKELIEECKVLL